MVTWLHIGRTLHWKCSLPKWLTCNTTCTCHWDYWPPQSRHASKRQRHVQILYEKSYAVWAESGYQQTGISDTKEDVFKAPIAYGGPRIYWLCLPSTWGKSKETPHCCWRFEAPVAVISIRTDILLRNLNSLMSRLTRASMELLSSFSWSEWSGKIGDLRLSCGSLQRGWSPFQMPCISRAWFCSCSLPNQSYIEDFLKRQCISARNVLLGSFFFGHFLCFFFFFSDWWEEELWICCTWCVIILFNLCSNSLWNIC